MRTIFITGAAAGIGRATAELFASRGWFVGLGDRDEAAIAALAVHLGASRASAHPLDVTDHASVRDALDSFVASQGGHLHVLHNNAGVLRAGAFESLSPADHRLVVDVNVTGLIHVLHAAFPHLKRTPGSQVVNMSSISAMYGVPDFATYSATKHAVRALTEALDIEWAKHDIKVTDLMPPFVNTGMVRDNAGASRIIDRLGVNLEATDIAAEVWSLVQDPELHRPVTRRFRAIWPLARGLPQGVSRGLLKLLSGH